MINLTLSPDLQTRESVMVAVGRVQLALTDDAGWTRYIKVECKRKNASGQGYERGTVALDEATHVFVSEKGYGTARVGTYYPAKNSFYEADGVELGHVAAFRAVVDYVNGDGLPGAFASIEAESACGMCGRRLEDPISIQRGIGPDCAAKPTGTRILHASAFVAEAPAPAVEAPLARTAPPVASTDLIDYIRTADDATLDSVIAIATREQEKREHAKREAAEEAAAHASKWEHVPGSRRAALGI